MPPTGPGSGSGPMPPNGEGMQCSCKCNCPGNGGECDCNCNCPNPTSPASCASGFTQVCPMMDGMCPNDMMEVCIDGMPTTMRSQNRMYGQPQGCQCVPDFLMALGSQLIGQAQTRSAAPEEFKGEAVKVGKRNCKCNFLLFADGTDLGSKSKGNCDKKCSGVAKGVELEGDSGNVYTFDMKSAKGKVTFLKGSVAPAAGSSSGSGIGGGPGSGMGSGPISPPSNPCICVGSSSMGPGPMPGSGSGPMPGPMPGSGSGTLPGSGSGPMPGSGSGSGSGAPTAPGSGSGSTGAAGAGYSQAWLRGDEPYGHVHEGIRLEARDGWVGVGDRIKEEGSNRRTQVMVRRVDNDGKLVWTYMVGDTHTSSSKMSYSAGYSIIQSGDKLFVGGGLWQKNQNVMKAVVIALDVATGNMLWTKLLNSRPKNGGVRSVIMDGDRIIGTGYTNCEETGFLFVADGAEPMVWELSKTGDLVKESVLNVEGLGQGAKIRKDTSGFIVTSTAWAQIGGQDHEHVALIKLSSDLSVEWSKMYGVKGGSSQVFDMLVDRDGNYLCGGHTTIGTGVVNWDYLALKVNSQTRDVEWRKTYGQPRGFDPRYIHDEMYGVALDPAGNYLLLGGSGDEYPYSATNSTTGEQSDIWVSYLITVDTNGNTLAQGVYGNKLGNNAGEYLSVDNPTGEVMIFTDSDTNGGFGFLKLTPN